MKEAEHTSETAATNEAETSAPAAKLKGKRQKPADLPPPPAGLEPNPVRVALPAGTEPWSNLTGRELIAVQFHQAPAGLDLNTTGIHVADWKKRLSRDVELRLVGPGVWVRTNGKEFVVPFANILRTELKV